MTGFRHLIVIVSHKNELVFVSLPTLEAETDQENRSILFNVSSFSASHQICRQRLSANGKKIGLTKARPICEVG
jgi:hypothetical protein